MEITFDLEIRSTDKTRSIANNVGRALMKKKMLMLGSKKIDTMSKPDIYDIYKDLYISEKERQERLFQGI